jgi:Gpi18-like mannosyltransferase
VQSFDIKARTRFTRSQPDASQITWWGISRKAWLRTLWVTTIFVVWRAYIQVVYSLSGLSPPIGTRLRAKAGPPEWVVHWFHWDTAWYGLIARAGYSARTYDPHQSNLAFFPLYPLSVRGLSRLTGLSYPVSGLLVAHVCALALAIVLYFFTAEEWKASNGYLAVSCLLLYPSSFFLVTAYAESMLLFLMILALYLAKRERWLGASAAAGLASAVAATGLIMGPVLLVMYVQKYKRTDLGIWRLILAPVGAGAYAVFLWLRFGSPMVWFETERYGWHRHLSVHSFGLIFSRWPKIFEEHTYYWAILRYDRIVFAVVLLVAVTLLIQKRWALGIMSLLAIAIPASSGELGSMNRYALTAIPVFALFGAYSSQRRWLFAAYVAICLPLMTFLIVNFLRGRWVG